MPEGGDDPIGDDRREIERYAREGIEANRQLHAGRVYIDEIVRARTRDMFERGAGEVAMRIEKRDACAALKILAQQVESLACHRATNNIRGAGRQVPRISGSS